MSAPSSPASSREGSPAPMLTPRSKIRALLATVDSSDEDGGAPTQLNKVSGPSVRSALAQLYDDDDDDESDIEVRPRGRLAARMQANSTSPIEKRPQNARERVRQMLEREEDDLPVAPRRLQRRAREATPDEQPILHDESNPYSPGLFVSSPAGPSPSRRAQQGPSDSESDDLPAVKSDRFKALVERKRQERLAREAKEEAERDERRARQEKLSSELDGLDSNDDAVSDIDDDEGGHTLTQKSARPSRKASKKAIEEMNRETQRMARSMQLAHEAKTRKKITKSSLFERFNFRPNGQDPEPIALAQPASSSRPATPQSDAEMEDAETPPSSPPSAKKAAEVPTAVQTGADEAEDLPTLDEISVSVLAQPIDKGKGKAIEVTRDQLTATDQTKKRVRVRLPNLINTLTVDADDELEITATVQDKVKAVFDNVPVKAAQESRSLQVLRALALVQSPDRNQNRRRKISTGLTNRELQVSLQQRAREQAKLERTRRLDLLKSQGIVVQTMEEREKQMEEVEDIVAKAREEVQRLMDQEREAAKKEKKDGTAADPLAWDDSDDEYEASENGEEVEAIELSGSEDDEGDDADDESDAANPLFDDEAEDSDGGEETKAIDDEDMEDEAAAQTRRRRARNVAIVLSDDEDEMEIKATPKPAKLTNQISPAAANGNSPAAPGSVLRSAKKTFIPGLPVKGPAGLGLTQIFAGTMDDSQMGTANGPTQSMMPDFDQFPDSNFSAPIDQPDDNIVEDSQRPETQGVTQGIRLNMSQSQMHGLDSLMRDYPDESQTIELSQDGGFQAYTPLKERFVEPPFSTVATDIIGTMEEGPQASPLLRRGKLRRKADVEKATEPTQPIPTEVPATAPDAFAKLKEEARQKEKRRLADAFNAKTSKAKEMVEQEAMESDDEYAGLGGVDGEDSDNESTASVKEMIDDATANDADDSKLAAFYADRARAEDEQQVEKLFKDITTGMLRRKRGADYDLSDSDDDGEARRRMKRRQFAKMQKALFADERVKKMAENPGNQAFLRTIEDRGSDDEMDILEIYESPSQRDSSQSPAPESQNAAQQTIPDSQPQQPARQVLGAAQAGGENDRAPARMRRTKNAKKPSNIGEVRETLSNLLEEPDASLIPATEAGSDSEGDDDEGGGPRSSNKENRSPRRTVAGVVDRISLKRGNSNASTSSSRLAFASAASASTSGAAFKVPPLLRRATTNSSIMSTAASSTTSSSSASTAAPGGGFGDEKMIKRAAGKRSGVVSRHAVPANEGHARIQESERRREEKKMKGAEKRLGVVGGLLGRGSFA
ncbi:DNA replication checkpoint mediator [Cordyceps javanica]|uniref:DNA replication checkpoint mediator n=1 Tax=Cordyceps javanica TaxID=43265 RepID=A0A545UWZ1_9HYPO|nr:DNA replication checkpoint mediator [Cordyceps javanica]TQW01716.1 DNA replication checkpoint mediator [Cordyceps javanica]